jgi:succinyl-diaminopimelate desuccinylase
VKGIQGHVAYPERADNPIHRVVPALTALVQERWDQGNEFFPPTSFQVSNFNSGTGAGNVIPGDATVRFNFRYSSAVTKEDLKSRVHGLLDVHRLKYGIDWRPMGDPFLTPPGELSKAMQEAVEKATGLRPRLDTGGGTSDGRFIAPTGAQVVEFGPRNASIHKIDECVAVAELEQLTDIYVNLLKKLLG